MRKNIIIMFIMALMIAFSSCNSCHRENEPIIEPSIDTTELVVENPEIMPEYVGGIEAMQQFIVDNLQIPEKYKDIQETTEYRVVVKFVIEKDGSVTEAEVIEPDSLIQDLNIEALKVVNAMPNWNPGMLNDEPVRVIYALPIVYKFGE